MGMSSLLRSLVSLGGTYVLSELLVRKQVNNRRLKGMLWGFVMIIGASIVGSFALIALLSSFFFIFSDLLVLAQSALMTSLVAFVVVIVMLYVGWRMVFRK